VPADRMAAKNVDVNRCPSARLPCHASRALSRQPRETSPGVNGVSILSTVANLRTKPALSLLDADFDRQGARRAPTDRTRDRRMVERNDACRQMDHMSAYHDQIAAIAECFGDNNRYFPQIKDGVFQCPLSRLAASG